MRLAWFRAHVPADADPLDDTAALIATLRSEHRIEVFTGASAHDFVWNHFRAPCDLCVFELDNTSAHAFVWPYLLQYGGVLLLRTVDVHDSRARMLAREGRREDYINEFTFNEGHPPRLSRAATVGRGLWDPAAVTGDRWPMLRVPLLASRAAVVPHKGVAVTLQEQYPEARIRYAPVGVPAVPKIQTVQDVPGVQAVTFGVLSTDRVEVVRRAVTRAHEGGAVATLIVDAVPERVLQADVIVTLRWPHFDGPQTLALTALAAGKPVVVLETETSADWPALDPQTWHPRGFSPDAPIAVSIDLRDEEHSLVATIKRFAADRTLRAKLGEAAYRWWRTHATVSHAADAWRQVLSEAATIDPPARPADWPAHLNADGTERARAILDAFGVTVDLFGESTELRSGSR